MVQIHEGQRSIQMIISHRDTHINTAQTSTMIINNGSKNSKCKPIIRHTINEKRQQQCELFR